MGVSTPVAQAAASEEFSISPDATADEVGTTFLQTTSDLWFLLSGIRDKDDADRAADRFTELVKKVFALDDRFSEMSMSGTPPMDDDDCAGQLDDMQVRILESFEDLNSEFTSLCRVHCYGSRKLSEAFQVAVSAGMFVEDEMVLLQDVQGPLSEEETRQELVRLKRLVEPDRAVLDVLEKVKDAVSAGKAVPELSRLSQRLRTLLPDTDLSNRAIPESDVAAVQDAYTPIEPLLWGIRNELVRIAGLPGYETEPYDEFSSALETVFDNLGKAHSSHFEAVFDACFRDDMDAAVQEKATTSSQ